MVAFKTALILRSSNNHVQIYLKTLDARPQIMIV